jgi:hypothetical protein
MKQLAKIGMLGMVFLCLTGNVEAGERQERRIEQLERENMSLRRQVEQLRYQYQRQGSYGTPYRYGYGSSGLSGANRQLREAEQMKRSWEKLMD